LHLRLSDEDEEDRVTLDAWLQTALADAERRGLPDLKPLLETLARATALLRSADWNDDAAGRPEGPPLLR
jgi:hypothetical protein